MTVPKANPRMTTTELLDEVEFFLSQQEHPAMIAQILGRRQAYILKLANRDGRTALVEAFKMDAYLERSLKKAS